LAVYRYDAIGECIEYSAFDGFDVPEVLLDVVGRMAHQ
jgi:hypothetical protein